MLSELISEVEKLRKERTLPGEIKHPASDRITGGVRYVRRIPECQKRLLKCLRMGLRPR